MILTNHLISVFYPQASLLKVHEGTSYIMYVWQVYILCGMNGKHHVCSMVSMRAIYLRHQAMLLILCLLWLICNWILKPWSNHCFSAVCVKTHGQQPVRIGYKLIVATTCHTIPLTPPTPPRLLFQIIYLPT